MSHIRFFGFFLVLLAGLTANGNSAQAAELTGVWHARHPINGKWYAGPWRLKGTGNSRTMYLDGAQSYCPNKPIKMKYTEKNGVMTITGRGCGEPFVASGKVGSSRIDVEKNKFGEPYITGIKGW